MWDALIGSKIVLNERMNGDMEITAACLDDRKAIPKDTTSMDLGGEGSPTTTETTTKSVNPPEIRRSS